MPVLDNYINVHAAAEVLGVHWETVKRMCREGRMLARKVHNMWLIDKGDLTRFAANYNEPRCGKSSNNFERSKRNLGSIVVCYSENDQIKVT